MRSTLFSLVLLAAPMALFSGCVDSPDTTDVDDEDAPEYRVMGGGTGSQGHNGLDFAPYALFDTALGQAMKLPLVVPGTDTVSPEVANLLLVPYAGRATFEYAMYCALPEKMTVYWNGLKYEGLGHVAKADKWLQGPLPEPVQDDVYACMAAHVNSIDDINILLQGAHVNPDEATHEDFDVVEAIWYAKQNVDDVPLYVGIPLEPLQKKCGGDPAIALAHRFCGQNLLACELKEGNIANCEHDKADPDIWTCEGIPAIQTRLRLKDFETFYNFCQ